MNLKVSEKKEEPLLSRKRLVAELEFDAAVPSRKDVKAKIAQAEKADEKLIIIKKIKSAFRSRAAKVICCIYQDEKSMEKIEKEHSKKSGEKKEEAPKEEKKEPPKAEEKKPEEKKEEKPKEEKK